MLHVSGKLGLISYIATILDRLDDWISGIMLKGFRRLPGSHKPKVSIYFYVMEAIGPFTGVSSHHCILF